MHWKIILLINITIRSDTHEKWTSARILVCYFFKWTIYLFKQTTPFCNYANNGYYNNFIILMCNIGLYVQNFEMNSVILIFLVPTKPMDW